MLGIKTIEYRGLRNVRLDSERITQIHTKSSQVC